jgi:hypothetical protein
MTPSLSLKRFGLTAFVMLLIVAPLIMQGAAAAPQVVSWGPTEVRSTTDTFSDNYSAIDTDSNGKIHISWFEYGSSNESASKLFYTNNVSGSWLTPYQVTAAAGRGAEPLLDMKVLGNQVHFLYINSKYTSPPGNESVVHRYLTLNGATPSPTGSTVSINGTQKGANPRLIVDNIGRLHAFYITGTSLNPTYQVYHAIWSGGPTWRIGLPVNADGVQQKLPSAVATVDGKIHLAFLSGTTFRYYIYNNGAWQRSTDIYSGKPKLIHLSTNGSTIFVLYTAEATAVPGIHSLYLRQGGNGTWTQPVEMSAQGSFNRDPYGYYNAALNTLFIFWSSGPLGGSEHLMVREYTLGGATSGQLDLGGAEVQYPRATGFGTSVSVIWQDKISGTYDIRMRTSGTGPQPTPTTGIPPTPIPTAPPTASLVDFAFTRTSGSPTNNANVGVTITQPTGSPNQMRYSLTPFAANSSLPAWQTLQTAFNVNTSAGIVNCGVAIYAQVRNSSNGAVSPVRAVTASVDTTIQSTAAIYTMESPGASRPADVRSEQPYAPNGGDSNYTRSFTFNYHFNQEPPACSGLKSYQVETYAVNPSPMPDVVDEFAPFNPFNTATDTNGVGLIEQTMVANLILTDTLGNKTAFAKTIFYDDDPPVLSPGGSITFPSGASTSLSLTSISFTAVVTDDGYTNSAPATKKYWGAWIVATKSATLPGPEVFAQYGKVHALAPGGTTLAGVNLTNDYNQESPPAMRTAGPRYIHMRFLDGAGNYSEAGITSPVITLNAPFVDGSRRYMPVVSN